MIALVGFLLLASAAPVQSSAPAADQAVASRNTANSSPSFEQVSRAATQAWSDNRDDDAIRLFQQGLKIKPDWDEGFWYLGAIFYEKERFREARELLRHYVAQHPKQGAAWALIGLCDYKLGEYKRALDHLQRSVPLGVGGRKQLETAVLFHRAILLIRDGQFDSGMSALFYLRSGLELEAQSSLEIPAGLSVVGYPLLPEEVPAVRREFVRRMGAAAFARLDQRREEAKSILRDLLREYPNEKGVHYQYGSLLLEDDPAAGVEEMQKVVAISPSSAEARLKLAEYYLSRSQEQQARSYVDEALKLEPLHPLAHLLKGQILNASGDASGAIKEFEQARQLAPEESRVLWALLRAYTAAGRREDAARVKAEIEKTEGTALLPK